MCSEIQGIPQEHQLCTLGCWGSHGGLTMSDSLCPLLLQAISISKAINTQEAPVKEKHARRILSLGSQDSTEELGLWGCHPLMLEEIWETEIHAELSWGLASPGCIHQRKGK